MFDVVIWSETMTEGLFERYFRLLAGQLPAAEYGVLADETDETGELVADAPECLC